MNLIVQKYGGTSLENPDAIKRVARRIVDTRDKGIGVVVVVSAMGNTTDQLIAMAEIISSQPQARELDVLLSTGELQSATLMAMALHSLGCAAVSLSGGQAGILTDSRHRGAKISTVKADRILTELQLGKVVIVAGFQGINENTEITTLERGGSDTTAVAIAAGISAERCEIYTDVSGIHTADPRMVKGTRRLKKIGFEEMLELASYGAKFPPQAIEMALVYNVPILVTSSFDDGPGTLIHKESVVDKNVGQLRNGVRAIATDKDVGKITGRGLKEGTGAQAAVFSTLSQADISVDVIVQNTSVDGLSDLTFTVNRSQIDNAIAVTEEIANTLGAFEVTNSIDLAKISIVGTGMQNVPGYAARTFQALADAGINIELITTSEIRITCVIEETRLKDAARVLHDCFELGKNS